MVKKTLFVYNSLNLFHILNEIKKNFYFELEYIDTKNHKRINFEQYKNYFNEMVELKKTLNVDDLSMGMSEDYLDAVACGATYIRIGSKIFGDRS